jgi:DNA-binding MarR family transcriptional regulator
MIWAPQMPADAGRNDKDWAHPGEIARRLGTATPTIVNTATRMEEAGLVVGRPDPADARLVHLHLTPAPCQSANLSAMLRPH